MDNGSSKSKRTEHIPVAVVSLLGTATLVAGIYLVRRFAKKSQAQLRREDSREEMSISAPRPGDILLFFRPNRLRDYIIEWVTGSRFYHVALWAGDGRVVEARPKGVVEEGLEGREQEYIIVSAPRNHGWEALSWARTQIGAPFDTTDIFVTGLEHLFKHWKINYVRPDCYTCSELVVSAFRHSGVDLLPGQEVSEIAPGDIAAQLTSHRREKPFSDDGLLPTPGERAQAGPGAGRAV